MAATVRRRHESDRLSGWLAHSRLTCQLRMSFLADGGRIGRTQDQLRIRSSDRARGGRWQSGRVNMEDYLQDGRGDDGEETTSRALGKMAGRRTRPREPWDLGTLGPSCR